MPQKESIRIREARPLDRFNDPIGEEKPWRDVTADAVVPRSSDDYEQRGPVIISGYMVKLAGSVEVNDTDEIEIRGRVYQVDGVVADYGRVKLLYTMRAN